MESFCSSKSIFSGISKAYLEDADFQQKYFTYNPDDQDSWSNRSQKVIGTSYRRAELVEALRGVNTRLGASEKTFENIDRLKSASTVCVVTGQQTGIFGGPLFTLYKAATAIKKARDLREKHGVNAVPIFWMASEDHDFDEAREISIIDDGKLKKLRVDKKPGKGANNLHKTMHNYSYIKEPVGWIDMNTSVKSVLIEGGNALRDTPYAQWSKEVFENTAHEDETLSDWFGRIYLKLFKEEGLIVIDPLDKKVRELGVDFLKEAAEKSSEIIQSVLSRKNDLEKLGYSALIQPRDGATGLYYLERGERIPIIKEEGLFTIREGDDREAFCLGELLVRMESHPEEFSTNVILRPVIQDVYLPTVAYVAGPGEASYYAQLKDVYKAFGMEMPIILPRENFTVCSGQLRDTLSALDLSVEDVLKDDKQDVEQRLLKSYDEIDVDGLFDNFARAFENDYSALIDKIESIDQDILEISRKNKELIYKQFDYLRQKSHRFHRRNHKDELKMLTSVYDWVKPYGGLQERSLGLMNILSIAGPDFVDYVTNKLEYDRNHRVVLLDREGVEK